MSHTQASTPIRVALALFFACAVAACGRTADPVSLTPLPPDAGPSSDPVAIQLDAATRYQTVTGWETGIPEAGGFPDALPQIREELLDAMVDVGLNRLRVEVRSGLEHRRDNWAEWKAKKLGKDDPWWRSVMFATENDNDDPNTIDPAGFHFADLDFDVDEVVTPLRARLAAQGERLYVNVTYTAFTQGNPFWSTYVHRDPEEYAEFVLATYQHLQQKYGWVPDSWEVILEPDNTFVLEGSRGFLKNWTYWHAADVGRAIAAAGRRLKAAGFTPHFVAPSTLNAAKAAPYFDEAMAVPGASEYLKELSYHRYSDASDAAVAAIGRRAEQHGIDAAMLEEISADYHHLHTDLTLGHNSGWAQYRLATVGKQDSTGIYFRIDRSDPARPRIVMNERTKFFRQYFRFVRSGAQRIGARTSSRAFDPVAFVNRDGGTVVVVKATRAGAFTLAALPAATYGLKYTTAAAYDKDLPDVTVMEGGSLSAAIPDAGVLTAYRKATP